MKKVKSTMDDSAHARTPGKETPTNGEILMNSLLDHIAGLKVSTVISEKTDSPPSPPPGSQPEHSEPTPGNQTTGLQTSEKPGLLGKSEKGCSGSDSSSEGMVKSPKQRGEEKRREKRREEHNHSFASSFPT